jgi:hypothetical protein
MADELETVLRLVADGTLTPEQAAPIIEALSRSRPEGRDRAQPRIERAKDAQAGADERVSTRGRQLRIRVTEHGRQVVNLRIPIGFVDAALSFVPGIGGDQSERIRQAVAAGSIGPIIDVEDPEGDSVLISVE